MTQILNLIAIGINVGTIVFLVFATRKTLKQDRSIKSTIKKLDEMIKLRQAVQDVQLAITKTKHSYDVLHSKEILEKARSALADFSREEHPELIKMDRMLNDVHVFLTLIDKKTSESTEAN